MLIIGTILLIEVFLGLMVMVCNSSFPLIILAGLIVFTLFFLSPIWGYLTAIFLLSLTGDTFSYDLIGGITLRPRDIVFPPVLLGWFLAYTFRDEKRLPIEKTDINNTLFVVGWFCILSFIWATGKGAVISKSIQYVFDLGLFFLTLNIVSKRNALNNVLKAWCAGGIFISLVCIGQLVIGGGRSKGLTESSLGLGEFLGYPFIVAVYFFITARTVRLRILAFGAAATIFLGMVTTQARGPMIGLAAGLFFIFLMLSQIKGYLRPILKYFGCFSVVLLISMTFLDLAGMNIFSELFSRIYERFTSTMTTEIATASGAVDFRLTRWKAALGMFFDNPVLGVGVGNFSTLSMEYGLSEPSDCAHNIYLQLLAEFGILGSALIAYLIYRLLAVFYRFYKNLVLETDKIFLICLIAGIIAKGVRDLTFGFFIEDRAFFLFAGLGFALAKIAEIDIFFGGET